MANQRNGERETFWRQQVRRQAASGLRVRRFCAATSPPPPPHHHRPNRIPRLFTENSLLWSAERTPMIDR